MIPAVALPAASNFGPAAPPPTRDEALARFQQLDEIREHHYLKALDLVPPGALVQHARRLGLLHREADPEGTNDLLLACDLAVHTAPAGRSRAIDRYARNAQPPAGSDEARVLEAMCKAHFAVLKVVGPHPVAGVILNNPMREEGVWLLDDELDTWLTKGMLFATRLFTPEDFSMTTGVGVRINVTLLKEALASMPQLLRRKDNRQISEDPRFAEAVYRSAIEAEIRRRMIFEEALAV